MTNPGPPSDMKKLATQTKSFLEKWMLPGMGVLLGWFVLSQILPLTNIIFSVASNFFVDTAASPGDQAAQTELVENLTLVLVGILYISIGMFVYRGTGYVRRTLAFGLFGAGGRLAWDLIKNLSNSKLITLKKMGV